VQPIVIVALVVVIELVGLLCWERHKLGLHLDIVCDFINSKFEFAPCGPPLVTKYLKAILPLMAVALRPEIVTEYCVHTKGKDYRNHRYWYPLLSVDSTVYTAVVNHLQK